VRIDRPERRLDGFWGQIDRRHNAELVACVRQGPVLDVGCGYGTLTRALGEAGIEAVGVDADPRSLDVARGRCSDCRFVLADARALPFPAASFSTLILRDSLHHLVAEPAWAEIAAELMRVLAPGGRVVVMDPNMTTIVRVARVVARHRDEACTVERARSELEAIGLQVAEPAFHTIFSLPLSGGYVGVELVPRLAWLHRVLLRIERAGEELLRRLGLLPRVAWRYLLVADRP
jgi:ubiquinone/menaquinone biosynthesis C-methylase UbiE